VRTGGVRVGPKPPCWLGVGGSVGIRLSFGMLPTETGRGEKRSSVWSATSILLEGGGTIRTPGCRMTTKQGWKQRVAFESCFRFDPLGGGACAQPHGPSRVYGGPCEEGWNGPGEGGPRPRPRAGRGPGGGALGKLEAEERPEEAGGLQPHHRRGLQQLLQCVPRGRRPAGGGGGRRGPVGRIPVVGPQDRR